MTVYGFRPGRPNCHQRSEEATQLPTARRLPNLSSSMPIPGSCEQPPLSSHHYDGSRRRSCRSGTHSQDSFERFLTLTVWRSWSERCPHATFRSVRPRGRHSLPCWPTSFLNHPRIAARKEPGPRRFVSLRRHDFFASLPIPAPAAEEALASGHAGVPWQNRAWALPTTRRENESDHSPTAKLRLSGRSTSSRPFPAHSDLALSRLKNIQETISIRELTCRSRHNVRTRGDRH